MIKDYYKILDIRLASSQEEIKSSFRKLAVFWHPDRNSNPIALQKMQEINEAYSILSDSAKRETYNKIYQELFNKSYEVAIYKSYEQKNNTSEKDEQESYRKEREEFVNKKYEKEINELNNWIKNIKFSLGFFDRYLDKTLAKVDRPIENFVYYFPVVLGIIFLIIILLNLLMK